MIVKYAFSKLIGWILLAFLLKMTDCGTIAPSASAHRNLFAADIFQTIVSKQQTKNVVFSPASIQTCLVLASLGADGKTADEMRSVLKLGNMQREAIAQNYAEHLKTAYQQQNTDSGDDDKAQLSMANRIYVNDNIHVLQEFNELASKNFQTVAENINFGNATNAANTINSWVEHKTNNKIKDLINANSLSSDTTSVLVNAIYFKAKWALPFSLTSTYKTDFHVNSQKVISVDMMINTERVQYAELPELDATAVQLAYKNTDLTMLILLPNKIDGLHSLESKLAKRDLNDFTNQLQVYEVEIFLPKFRIEFDVDLKPILKDLGMNAMFSNDADFSRLFSAIATKLPQKIGEVRHKAFLDVNEAGSEAAAATFIKIVPMSLNLNLKRFMADHPFVFMIRSPTSVYFAGHVTFE